MTKFKKSRLYISSLFPMIIGMVVGFLSALMGIGGGYYGASMIYLLGMHIGSCCTTLFRIFVSINATFWQASKIILLISCCIYFNYWWCCWLELVLRYHQNCPLID